MWAALSHGWGLNKKGECEPSTGICLPLFLTEDAMCTGRCLTILLPCFPTMMDCVLKLGLGCLYHSREKSN